MQRFKTFILGTFLLNSVMELYAQQSEFIPRTIDLTGRIRMEYVEKGNEKGIPVIFIHGLSDSWYSYYPVLSMLDERIHAFSVSLRGHGNSAKPADGYAMHDFSDDIAAFMQFKGIGQAVIVGHSLGGSVAVDFASRYPKRTLGLVLISAFSSFTELEIMKEFEKEVNNLPDTISREFVDAFQKSTITKKIPETFYEGVVSESMKLPSYAWKSIGKEIFKLDNTEAIRKIGAPTLILFGNKDLYCTMEQQVWMNKNIRDSKLLVYNETGHAIQWEDPERYIADLLGFIQNLPSKKVSVNNLRNSEQENSKAWYWNQ